MPRIIVASDAPGEAAPLITLSERIVADNLESRHYAEQLVERIIWAAADAEAAGRSRRAGRRSRRLTGRPSTSASRTRRTAGSTPSRPVAEESPRV